MITTERNVLKLNGTFAHWAERQGVVAAQELQENAAPVLTRTRLVNWAAFPRRFLMREWIKRFVVNRLLYMVLLTVLCLGIFPFVTFFSFTMWIGRTWDSISPNKTHAAKIEGFWDIIGRPYDYLVKLVG